MIAKARRDPKTKAEVLNRMFSFDFDGDIRHLGAEPAHLSRTAENKAQITFPSSGQTFELVIRRPRAFAKVVGKTKQVEVNQIETGDGDEGDIAPAPKKAARKPVRRKRA